VKLADTRAERDLQGSLAEIFSIIVTLDELEKAFLKDAIPEADYAEICERSLKQYKSILADETVARAFVGLEEFKAEWDVSPRHTVVGRARDSMIPKDGGINIGLRYTARGPPRNRAHPGRHALDDPDGLLQLGADAGRNRQHQRRPDPGGHPGLHHVS
jgi:hypothetical protein